MKELFELRQFRSMTQVDLSKKSGVSQQSISCYENGSRIPDSNKLRKLALALEVSADDLLGITEEVKKFKAIQKEIAINIIKKSK